MRQLPLKYLAPFLTMLLLLISCSSTPIPSTRTATPTQALTSPLLSVTMPAVALTPDSKLMAQAPRHCPASPALSSKVFPAGWGGYLVNTTMPGHTPVWETGIDPNFTVGLESQGYTPWPGTKILWEVGPNYTSSPVTVKVSNLSGGQPAWWSTDEGGPPPAHASQTLVLNTVQPTYHGSPVQGWQEWGSVLYIFQAGCYALDTTWPGEHWRLIFAAGR